MLAALYTIASLAALVLAQIQSGDPNPPVVDPRSGTEWKVGATETVAWDTTGIIVTDPAGRPIAGKVVLGYLKSDGQYLYQSQPLASGFLLSEKQTQVVVPEVPSGKYFIALEGDTGNWSQIFTITNPKEPSGTPPASIVVTPVSSATASSTTSSGSASTTSASASASATSTSSSAPTTSGSSGSSSVSDGATSSGTSTTATSPPSSTHSSTTSAPPLATVLSSSTTGTSPSATNTPNAARGSKMSGPGVVLSAAGLLVGLVL